MFYSGADVKQVDVPSFSGSFGILPNHVPTLAVIKPGVISVYESEGAVKKYFGIYSGLQIIIAILLYLMCKQLAAEPLPSMMTLRSKYWLKKQFLSKTWTAVPPAKPFPKLNRN